MPVVSKTWFEVLSELFVSFSAGWFGFVFIEPQIGLIKNPSLLLFKFFLGTLTLMIAKQFRDEARIP